MPVSAEAQVSFSAEIESVCDELIPWQTSRAEGMLAKLMRLLYLFHSLPVTVALDRDKQGTHTIQRALDGAPDVVVFDFPHAAILSAREIRIPSVMFTHNIEAEILKRHIDVADSALMKSVWRGQYEKMCRYEKEVLAAFDAVVAVSDRDRDFFRHEWGIEYCDSIPTGVDTDFFSYQAPKDEPLVVFCGSMDWMANIDAMEFFHDSVWPLVRERLPDARMKVVGRNPPDALVRHVASMSPEWQFTGFVDDVRDHVGGAAAFVIPLRVGGGTRIKAFEAMAIGTPVVSTSIGIEGLPLRDGEHYLNADEPEDLADSIVSLLTDAGRRRRISVSARDHVEKEFGFRKAAAVFERICLDTVERLDSGV